MSYITLTRSRRHRNTLAAKIVFSNEKITSFVDSDTTKPLIAIKQNRPISRKVDMTTLALNPQPNITVSVLSSEIASTNKSEYISVIFNRSAYSEMLGTSKKLYRGYWSLSVSKNVSTAKMTKTNTCHSISKPEIVF